MILATLMVVSPVLAAGPAASALPATADPAKDPAKDSAKTELLSPAAVGWGNLLVPGLGATLSDRPLLGLTEAVLEIGTFYGGTLLAPEGRFRIDGSIDIPASGHIANAANGETLQQFGLKYHFYNTFFHYQQAVLAREAAGLSDNNPQPIYRGSWDDIITAPFKWKNLSSPWVWPAFLGVSAYLVYSFSTSSVIQSTSNLNAFDHVSYAFNQIGVVPVGSSFGEDPLFRGFMQRELTGMTGSWPLAVAAQATLFALLHEDHLTSGIVGLYFGISTHALDGNIEPSLTAHFWSNVVLGVLDYWTLKRSVGGGVPFNPPIQARMTIPF